MFANLASAIKIASLSPASRPLARLGRAELIARFNHSLAQADGLAGAHALHELWMRGECDTYIEPALEQLWAKSADIPEWLPMRHVGWLPRAYEIAARFGAAKVGTRGGGGRSNIYLVLLDYRAQVVRLQDEPYGVYVGMSRYAPALRFDQHKAGIRSAGSVLKRGLEVLIGPTLHLQHLPRSLAARVEGELAAALSAEGLRVKGGH